MNTNKILDIICTICIIIITILCIITTIYILSPDKIYIQKWINPETGEEYIISDYPIIKIDKSN